MASAFPQSLGSRQYYNMAKLLGFQLKYANGDTTPPLGLPSNYVIGIGELADFFNARDPKAPEVIIIPVIEGGNWEVDDIHLHANDLKGGLLWMLSVGTELVGDQSFAYRDMLTDMIHVADHHGMDFDERLDSAREVYNEETSNPEDND